MFNIYLFIMKKIKFLLYFYLFELLFFTQDVLAVVSQNVVSKQDLATSNENVSIIFSFISKDLIINIVFAFFVMVWTFFLAKFLTSKIISHLEKSSKWDWNNKEELIWVLSRTVNITVLSIWALITLWILWIDTSILMWWIWFWIGFALKIFLTNFIAWILMVTQWYYHNWDIIQIWIQVWKIQSINALFTTIKQYDGIIFYVPNIKFMEENVSNFQSNDVRRVDIDIWVDYDTDILKAKEIILKVLDNFPNILKDPVSNIFVLNFWDNSINLGLRFWISSRDKYFQTKSNVTETINLAFKKYWIIIPFPQVTLSNRNNFETIINKTI